MLFRPFGAKTHTPDWFGLLGLDKNQVSAKPGD
jgi:hypothetical protein